MKRIAVIDPVTPIEGGRGIQATSAGSLFLRRCVTYFDSIEYPRNFIISIDAGNEVNHLQNIDLLTRPSVMPDMQNGVITINGAGDFMYDIVAKHLKERLNSEPNNQYIPLLPNYGDFAKGTEKVDSLLFDMTEMLPIPAAHVPFENIVKFKEKRTSEFIEFHHTLDEMISGAKRFLDNETYAKECQLTIERFALALKKLRLVSTEQKFDMLLEAKTSISVNWTAAAMAGYTAYEQTNSATASLTAAACTVGISTGIGKALKSQHPSDKQNLAYAVQLTKTVPVVKKSFEECID